MIYFLAGLGALSLGALLAVLALGLALVYLALTGGPRE